MKKLRERVEGNDGALTAPAGAERGGYGRGQRNARHASGGSTGHLCPLPIGHSPSPFPFFFHSLLLIQAVYSGGVVSELRALQQPGLGYIESLGFSVVLNPMSASLSTSLRADYGGALDRCVAIFGRADQHTAGAEGAPYRSSIKSSGVCSIVRRCPHHVPHLRRRQQRPNPRLLSTDPITLPTG
eukprot:scaffold21608_cov130-Isochrysis_galbana.AAC.2